MTVNFGAMDDLAGALAAVDGIRAASTDPAKLNVTPAVWVQAVQIDLDLLAGYTIGTRLLCLVADNGHERSMRALGDLLSLVLTVVDPTGPITPAPTILPGSLTVYPGLAVPFDLHATYEESA